MKNTKGQTRITKSSCQGILDSWRNEHRPSMGISKDWLRKTVLPRLAADGLVRRVAVSGARGWNLRYEWMAVTDNKEPNA